MTISDEWGDEPQKGYDDEAEPCRHGIWPRHECEWCEEEQDA